MTLATLGKDGPERRAAPGVAEAERAAPRPSAPASPSEAELGRFLEATLARPGTSRPLLALVLPAPVADGSVLLDRLARVDAFAFAGPSGPEAVALGVAAAARVEGAERFARAATDARALLDATELAQHPDAPPFVPRVFCGFAFAPGSAARDPWRGFGDGWLVLPRWTYVSGGRRAALVLVLDRRLDHGARPAQVRAELESILLALEEPPAPAPSMPSLRVRAEPGELHAARVSAALAEIESGRARKIVVSRTVEASADGSFEAGPTFRALVRGARRSATAFLVRRAGATFLGATPEHLLTLEGGVLRTMALAGTAAPHGADLLGSTKDLGEHAVVVEAITEALAPLSRSIEVEPAPRVTSAGPLLHLKTSISARLVEGTHALEVAGRLHPTPAVAGAPRETALRFLERAEPARGWYAGPIGWLDARGDAELLVALRCGLLRGGRAIAFAGGGIVPGSRVEDERAEADLKMRPFLDALGARLG